MLCFSLSFACISKNDVFLLLLLRCASLLTLSGLQLLEFKPDPVASHSYGESASGSGGGGSGSGGGSDNFVVRSFDLIGFDVIWRVALETQRPPVVKRSIAFLNSLHEKLSSELKVTHLNPQIHI